MKKTLSLVLALLMLLTMVPTMAMAIPLLFIS